jgi:Flp pilus assembly pilin Flp
MTNAGIHFGGLVAMADRLGQRLTRDERGQVTVEWTLLIAAFGIPMIWVFAMMLATLSGQFHMITTLISLPFP